MRPLTCSHHHDTARRIAKKLHHLRLRSLSTKYLTAQLILAMQVERMFAEIDIDQCWLANNDGLRKQNTPWKRRLHRVLRLIISLSHMNLLRAVLRGDS